MELLRKRGTFNLGVSVISILEAWKLEDWTTKRVPWNRLFVVLVIELWDSKTLRVWKIGTSNEFNFWRIERLELPKKTRGSKDLGSFEAKKSDLSPSQFWFRYLEKFNIGSFWNSWISSILVFSEFLDFETHQFLISVSFATFSWSLIIWSFETFMILEFPKLSIFENQKLLSPPSSVILMFPQISNFEPLKLRFLQIQIPQYWNFRNSYILWFPRSRTPQTSSIFKSWNLQNPPSISFLPPSPSFILFLHSPGLCQALDRVNRNIELLMKVVGSWKLNKKKGQFKLWISWKHINNWRSWTRSEAVSMAKCQKKL